LPANKSKPNIQAPNPSNRPCDEDIEAKQTYTKHATTVKPGQNVKHKSPNINL